MPRNLDLNLLRTLLALVEERSTTRAGKRLFLSQPAVSGALARLRTHFGDELLVRNGRALEPTARALELLEAIRPRLIALEAALTEATPFDPTSDARVFTFGCTDAVAMTVLPSLTASMRTDAPHCDLSVRVGDFRSFPAMLASGEASTVVGYLRDDPPSSVRVKVLRRSSWLVVRDAATPSAESLDDFCARPHVLVTPSGDLEGFVDSALAELGRKRRVMLGLTSFALLPSVLRGGPLIATVPDFVAGSLEREGGLRAGPCPLDLPEVVNTLAWSAATHRDPAAMWFRERVETAMRATA